jgi:hypothetical protein
VLGLRVMAMRKPTTRVAVKALDGLELLVLYDLPPSL